MADENHSSRRVATEHEQPTDVRPSTRPSPQSGPPISMTGWNRPEAGTASPHSFLSIFQNTGVAGPSSTPVSDFRHAAGAMYWPSGM